MLIVVKCAHCGVISHCVLKGMVLREDYGVKYYYLECKNCGKSFKKISTSEN
jgi:uncharacterized Zn finger protein